MIESLELTNFQKHEYSKFTFSPKINIITGETDQGKSSVIRALHWLFFNKPSGTEFIQWNQDNCAVQASINQNILIRQRDKQNNQYLFNNVQFDAVRSDVPNEIKSVINITNTNLQTQDDPYFLIYDSPGEIARKLNILVGLDKIDSSLEYINKYFRQKNTELKLQEKSLDDKKKELQKFKNLSQIEKLNIKYTKLKKQQEKIHNSLETIKEFCYEIEEFDYVIKQREHILTLEKKVETYKQLQIKFSKTILSLNKLKKLSKIKTLSINITKQQNFIKSLTTKLKTLLQLQGELKKTDTTKLVKQIKNIQLEQIKINKYSDRIDKYSIVLTELKKEMKICPLCDKPFGD